MPLLKRFWILVQYNKLKLLQGFILSIRPSDAIDPKKPKPPSMPTERPFVVG